MIYNQSSIRGYGLGKPPPCFREIGPKSRIFPGAKIGRACGANLASSGGVRRRRRKIWGFSNPFYTENPSLECILGRVFGVKEGPKSPKISACGGRIPPSGGQICAAGEIFLSPPPCFAGILSRRGGGFLGPYPLIGGIG